MDNVRVPDVEVKIALAGQPVAWFQFHRTSANPQDWEATAALDYADSKQAMRACLLACLAELQSGRWEAYTLVAEGGGETDDQLQLPWS